MGSESFRSSREGISFKYKLNSIGESMQYITTKLFRDGAT